MGFQYALTLQTEPHCKPRIRYSCNPATWLLRYLEALRDRREVWIL